MTSIAEGDLTFLFPETYHAVRKWDDSAAYRNGIGKLSTSKAIDIIAARTNNVLLVEVKDFRGHRIENKRRIRDGELAEEIAMKIRDTLAGIVGASRMTANEPETVELARSLTNHAYNIHVVLWLEQDRWSAPSGAVDVAQNTLEMHLKRHLRWLTTHVFLASRERCERFAGIVVRST